jgi:hypothetical protein
MNTDYFSFQGSVILSAAKDPRVAAANCAAIDGYFARGKTMRGAVLE